MVAKGTKIRTKEIVERFPFFMISPGATGVVVEVNDDYIGVKMDEPIEDCEEWDNTVNFYGEDHLNVEQDFYEKCEVLAG